MVPPLSAWGLAMLTVALATLALSAVTQIATPIHSGDEMMYHASRVLYWIQHQTVFPFVTHNDRQTLLPFGSELLFLWRCYSRRRRSRGDSSSGWRISYLAGDTRSLPVHRPWRLSFLSRLYSRQVLLVNPTT